MIKVDESDPVGELEPTFPYRDVTIKRGVDMKEFYDLEGEIGRGKFGTVFKCREKGTNLTLAAKFVGINRRQDRRNVEREVEIMSTLQHPRLIQLYDAFETDNVMCVVLELIEGGELFDRVISEDFILTEKACTVFMRQICEGVAFIHSNNIIHLDLKPENILCLTKTGNRIKIIDFGLARKFEPDKKLQVLFGTPEFVAPEVVNFDQISCATDMWSVGVICYVLLSGLSPFMGENDVETLANVTVARYDFEDASFDDISPEAKDFISKLLLKNKEDRFTADECLAHPWLRRKIPPPPPSLDNSKENLKVYVDKNVQNIKKSILIESDLKENPGVIEKLIDSQQKISYPHLISKPTSEFSLLTNAKFQEFLDHSKDSTQFLKPSNPNPKFNENISSKDRDEIISIKNIPEVNNKSNNSYIYPLVSTPNQFNQNKNTSIKKDAKTCFGDRKDNPINNSNVANQSTAIRGVIFENDSLKKTTLSNENIGKTHSKSNTLQRDSEMSVGMFETKPQIADELKSKVEPNKSGLIPKIVGSTLNEPEQGSSYMNSNQLTRLEESAKNKKITEETIVSHSFTKRQEENTWFDSSAKVLPTQIGKDNIQITLNDYKPEESARMFDLSKVSDFIRRSSIKLTEQEKTFNKTCEAFKDVTTTAETPSFKQHLRSTPPWFSELNNMHLKKPMLDRFERRSSDFSCFLNSKEDSISLNLADEIRKLSARLLQMSNTQNEPVDKYTLNPSARSDPISCFLENHGISHPRPKYKFSNLNRDVPIGSPPPPSNIAYYLNMQSNVNKKDSHSAPGSPRLSPDRGRMNTNKGVPTNTDQSSMGLDAEPKAEKETITLPSQYTSERNDIKMAAVQTKSEPLKNKQSKSKHQVP